MTEKDKEINELRREVVRLSNALLETAPKHAKWIVRKQDSKEYTICSECRQGLQHKGVWLDLRGVNFCPACGATMDETADFMESIKKELGA